MNKTKKPRTVRSMNATLEDLESKADPKGGEGHECLVFFLGGIPGHAGVVNFAFGDGSVRSDVEPTVGKVGTRN